MKQDLNLTEIEIAWLAGLLEGEGSFLRPPPSSPRQPRVCIQMTDEDIVRRVASLLDVTYLHIKNIKPEKWKPSYKLDITGSRALRLMQLVYPYMGERRKAKIDEIMALFKNQPIQSGKLTPIQAQVILDLKGTAPAREIAAQFQLHIKTVEKIWSGKRWGQLHQAAD